MNLFNIHKPVIAMIHVQALPGTPKNNLKVADIVEKACQEADLYTRCNVDAILIENMHDVPYLKQHVGPEITSTMTIVAHEIKRRCKLPCGVQILAGANQEALAVALASHLDFIRAEGFVFSHIADEGLMNACSAELLRFRKLINAEHIAIFTDIKKKHSSHAITSDVPIGDTAKAAEFFLSDGVIITGSETGQSANPLDIQEVRKHCNLPIIVGSGVTAHNLADFWPISDGFIVGSYFKQNDYWKNDIVESKVLQFMQIAHHLRSTPLKI